MKVLRPAEPQRGPSRAKRRTRRQPGDRLAFKHAREVLEGVFDATSDFVAAHDLQYRYIAFNEAYRAEFARIFGVTLEIGDSLIDALAHLPRDQMTAFDILQRALRGEAFTIVREFGDERLTRKWYEIRYAPLRDRRGKLIGATHVIRDVTEKHRAEEALREANATLERRVAERTAALAESEERLRTLIDNFPGAIYMKDRCSRILLMNQQCAAIMRVDRDAALGKSDDELFEDEDVARRMIENDRRVIENGAATVFEEVVPGEDGEHTYLSVKVPLDDARGEIYGLFGISTDITDRKRIEEALRESEARFRVAIDHFPGTFVIYDADHRLRFVNATGLKRARRREDELLGRLEEDVFPPGVVAPYRSARDRAFETGDTERVEWTRPGSSGDRTFVATFIPLKDDRGRTRQVLGIAEEITERKRVEETLRESDRRKNEFLGVLSHELRNPLAPVRNALWLLDQAKPGSTQAVHAKEIINRQIAHLSRIVDDLLDVTRITRGKIHLQRARIDLVELVRRTMDDYRTLFSAGEVAVAARLPQLPIWIDADPTRISQAVGNVLQNAAKFTDPGGHVEVTADRDAQGMAVVRVRDDGVGMEPTIVGRIFEPFIQADESLHRNRGGLGLGLSLVKGLIELHGGTVEARSDGPGRGAELVLRLPLAPEQPVVSGEPRGARGAMDSRRVLVIEDNADAADTLRQMLEMWGHEVEVASDGRAGVEKARAFRPDVVLCDIGLPVMDGYEVARAIHADPEMASTFLVAVSGYALPEDQRRAAEAGFIRHLGKPVPIEVMEDVLATAPKPGR